MTRPRSGASRGRAPCTTSPGTPRTPTTPAGRSGAPRRGWGGRRSSTATTSCRSISASHSTSCSRSPPPRPVSPSTRTLTTSARSCACPPSMSTCARSCSASSPRSPTRASRRARRPRSMSLTYLERPAAQDPAGLLVLHHGRGADEHDLLGLADVLDPQRRLHVVTPRGPLPLPGWPGYHWYSVPRVGYPDQETFRRAYADLAAFHDELWQRTGGAPADTVLGGFSMGSVMSYATGLGGDRPVPAGILAFSGFIPTVEGWQPDLDSRSGLPVLITHGRQDPIMNVAFARRAHELLDSAGLSVEYHESDAAHHIDPAHIPAATRWLSNVNDHSGSMAEPVVQPN